MNKKNLIRQTTDYKDFEICAKMMSASDPWITLGMNYEQCLMAFEGEYKEVYIIEYENQLAGFIILQVCGTFSGYIQTICIDEAFRGKGLGKILLHYCE